MTIRALHRSALTITALSVPILLASGCAGTDFKLTAEENRNAEQSTAQAIANMDNYMASLQAHNDEQTAAAPHESGDNGSAIVTQPDDSNRYMTDADDITTTLATLEKDTVQASLTDTDTAPATPEPGVMTLQDDGQTETRASNDATIDGYDIDPVSELQDELNEDIVSVSRPQTTIFHFPFDKAELDAQDIDTLRQHAQYLRHNPNLSIVIQGHTDNRGPAVYNRHLSEQRASKVAELLIVEDIAESRIRWEGLGDTLPMTDPGRWAENRRVELQYEDAYLVSHQPD